MGILSGAQTEELIRLLVDAYPSRDDFEYMLWTQLGIHLDPFAITGVGAFDYFRVLQAAEKDGWPRRFLVACRNGNPGNRELLAFIGQFDLSPPVLALEPDEIPLPKVVSSTTPKYQPPLLPSLDQTPIPGPLPPGSRIPYNRNEVFTGRVQDLEKLAKHLIYAKSTSGETIGLIEAVAATGMGGVGKTQLAVEFCYRYGRFIHGVHWIDATHEIKSEIANCGLEMVLQPWPEELEAQVNLTLQAITSEPTHLIVFDNLEDPGILQAWLPRMGQARVLVTSRREKWPKGSGVQTREVGVMSPADGKLLLRKLAERLKQVPDQELDEIGERLGWLPLALDLAGRYLDDRQRLNIQGYIDEMVDAGNTLAQSSLSNWVATNPTGHNTDLAATFLLSWQQLSKHEILAKRIFLTCSYFAPNTPIPYELLEGAALDEAESTADFDQALKRLNELGLLKHGENGPLIHPLLSEYARLLDEPAKSGQRTYSLTKVIDITFDLCLKAVRSGIPAELMLFRPHLEQVIYWADAIHDEDLANLTGIYANHLMRIADYSNAKIYYEQSLAIKQELFGEWHPATARSLNNLGSLMRATGDLLRAKTYIEQALAIQQKVLGSHHTDTATTLNNLGLLLRDLGDPAGARPFLEKALAIDKELVGDKHASIAVELNNLGLVALAMDDLSGAKAYFEQALTINQEVLGEHHPETAINLSNLGTVAQSMGDLTGAQQYYEQALTIDQEILGENHPQTAIDLNNLGDLYKEIGDVDGSIAYFKQALEINKKVFGELHPNTATIQRNLGTLLEEIGETEAAQYYYIIALASQWEVLGGSHPETAVTLIKLVVLLFKMGQIEKAQEYFDIMKAQVNNEQLPDGHPYVLLLKEIQSQSDQGKD